MSRQASTRAFARTASAASVLEPRLLRALRRELHPGLDAGAEADLLLSGLMAPGGGRFLRFRDDALAQLRTGLRSEIEEEQRSGGTSRILDGLRAAVRREHAAAPVTVRMHDELLLEWLATGRADGPQIQARLGSVLQASFDTDRPGVARWAAQLFAGLPSPMQAASPGQALRLMAGVQDDGGAPPDEQAFRRLLPHALKNLPKVLVGVKVLGGAIELRDGPVVPAGFLCFEVPGSEPRYLEVEQGGVSERLSLPVGGRVRHPVMPGPVLLRDGVGQRWELSVDGEAGDEGGICWVSWGGVEFEERGRPSLEETLAAHGWEVGERERARLLVLVGRGDPEASREDVALADARGVPVVRLIRGGDPRRTEVELGMKLRLLRSPEVLDYGPVLAAHEGLVPRRDLSAVLRRSVMEEARVAVVGSTGTGKTALLAELVRDLATEDDVVVCPVFLTRDAPSDDENRAMVGLQAWADAVHGVAGLGLSGSVVRAARTLEGVKQRLVLVLDGFEGPPTQLRFRLLTGATVVVSAPQAGLGPGWDTPTASVNLDDSRWVRETRAAMREVVHLRLQAIGYVPGDADEHIVSFSGPSFGALQGLLRWLELGAPFDSALPEGTGAHAVLRFARGWFQRLAPDQAFVLAALAAARKPLTLAQIDRVLRAADITVSLPLGAHPGAPPDLPVLALCDELPGDPARYRVSWPREVASQLPPSPRIDSALADTLARWPAPWGAPQEGVEYALRHRVHHLNAAGRETQIHLLIEDVAFIAERAALNLTGENRSLMGSWGSDLATELLASAEGDNLEPLAFASWLLRRTRSNTEIPSTVTFPERPFLHVLYDAADRAPEAPATLPLQGSHYVMGGFLHTWADREWRRLALSGEVETERLHAPVTAAAGGVLGFEDASVLLLNETGGTRMHAPSKAAITAVCKVGDRPVWGDAEGAVWQGARAEQVKSGDGTAITAVAGLGSWRAWADASGNVASSADGGGGGAHLGTRESITRSLMLYASRKEEPPDVLAGQADGVLRVGNPGGPFPSVQLGRLPLTIAWVGPLQYGWGEPTCVAYSSTTVYVVPLRQPLQVALSWAPHTGALRDVAVHRSKAGLQVITAGGDGRVGLWEMDGTSRGWLTGQTSAVGGVQVTPDDRLLARCEDGSVFCWSLSDRSLLAVLGDGGARWVALDVGPPQLAFGATLKAGVEIKAGSSTPLTPTLRYPPPVVRVLGRRHSRIDGTWHRRSGEDLLLYAADGDASIEVARGLATVRWQSGTSEWRAPTHASTTAAAFSPSPEANVYSNTSAMPAPRLLARGDRGGVVHLHRLADDKVEEPIAQSMALATESVRALHFLPGGETLLAAGDLGGLVLLTLPSPSESSLLRLAERGAPWRGHNLAIRAIDARAARVITASDDRTARIWDPATGTCRLILRHPAAVTGCALIAEGAVTACADGRVRVWDADRGALLDVFLCDSPVTALRRHPLDPSNGDALLIACQAGQYLRLQYRWPDDLPPVRIVGDQLVFKDGLDPEALATDPATLDRVLSLAADRLENEPNVGTLVLRVAAIGTSHRGDTDLREIAQRTFSSRLPHIALRFETTASPEGPSLTFWLER